MAESNAPAWQQTVSRKRQIRDQAIQRFVDARKSPSEIRQNADATRTQTDIDNVDGIVFAITSGAVTASQLCTAYIERAIEAHRRVTVPETPATTFAILTNIRRPIGTLTEVLFGDALTRARELDDFFKQNGRTVGPLHGVPMTLKDQFDVEGYDSTIGYVGRAFKPAKQDAVLVSMLKQLGAVVIAKSNLPQSIMWCETDNPLWGLTVHPRNTGFTSGGSTGGEGTLLNLQGSVVGWGTDIGGSVRIPSHMLGLYALKPSSSDGPLLTCAQNTRLPYHGLAVSTDGQEHVPSVIGPMARNIESLISVTKSVINARPWDLDPKCCPLLWRSGSYIESQTRPLVVGIMRDDGVVKPHPPVLRVLQAVADKLSAAGHELVEWKPGTLHQECIDIMDRFYTADGGEDIKQDMAAGGEPYIPHVEGLVNRGKPISVYQYWQLNKEKIAAQKKYLELWNSTVSPTTGKPIDILLTPVMPHSAVPHRKCRWVGYTKIFNVVDYPAVVIPAGEVSKELDAKDAQDMSSYQPRNALDQWNWDLFDLDAMDGMPVGVQIVARRLEEEKALGAAKVIDTLLKETSTP